MNELSLLDVPSQSNDKDSPRTAPAYVTHRAAVAYAVEHLPATHYPTGDRDSHGPCARCGALIIRYGPTCTSSLCVACNVLAWVQS